MKPVVAQIAQLIPKLRPADRDTVRSMLDNGCCIVECDNDSKFVRLNRHRRARTKASTVINYR